MFQFDRAFGGHHRLPETLLALLDACDKLVDVPIPLHVLNLYCPVRSDRSSTAAMDEMNSSTQDTAPDGAKNINKFTYDGMSPSTRPGFISFDFNEMALKQQVQSKFHGSAEQFQTLVTDLASKLTSLRCIIYSIKWVDDISPTAVWNEMRVQCMMQLFLNYTFQAWFANDSDSENSITATAANGNIIEFPVLNPHQEWVNWRGRPDLKCGSDDCASDIRAAKSTVEMKVPFSTSGLWHSKALQPKQQLLGQAIGIWHNPLDTRQAQAPHHTLSYLTDVFALSVMYYDGGNAYLSRRVTSAEEFCLRLLLTCCPSDSNWKELQAMGTTSQVDLEDESDDEDVEKDEKFAENEEEKVETSSSAVTRSQTRNSAGTMREGKENAMLCTIGWDDEEEAHERRQAELNDMWRWEAECLGVQFLGSKELQHCS